MERKIGEIFEYKGEWYQCVRGEICADCAFAKKHCDGNPCFDGNWFIVTAMLPTGQVSNHYKLEDWNLFDVPEVDLAPVWDGHTPEDAANRIEDWIRADKVNEKKIEE